MSRLLCLFILISTNVLFAQSPVDSTQTTGPSHFNSIGFNASSLSGLGLSYRNKLSAHDLFQLTGGVLDSEGRTNFSFGLEYQYQLSKKPSFRYYLAVGAGLYSDIQTTTFVGLGMGLELPIVGSTIFEGVTSGCCLFYPAINLSHDPRIGIGGSVYLFYNF
jgi:hypothetical protein